MATRWRVALVTGLFAGATGASGGDKTDVVGQLASRVGPIVGSALACPDIARPRIQVIIDKFTAVITAASSNEAERSNLTQLLDSSVAEGRGAVTSGRMDCRAADRQLADMEQSITRSTPGLSSVIAPSFVTAATAPTAPVPTGPAVLRSTA